MARKDRILCLHYYFPPIRSTAVIRNYQFTLAFSELFNHVYVLTSDNYLRYPKEEKELPQNVSVHDIYTLDYRTALGKKGGADSHISMKKKSSTVFQFIIKVQKSFPFNLFIGEGGIMYIYRAYRAACKIIDQGEVTTVYSSFAPYADHYVAHLLKRKYPSLKWIADFRDLQVEPIYKNVIWKGLQRRAENYVLKLADKVISVSESYTDQMKVYNRPTEAIFRGVTPRKSTSKYSKFTISYTGSLYFDFRDPSQFLRVLSACMEEGQIDKNDIQLVYAGRDGAQFFEYVSKYNLADIYHDRGMTSQEAAKEIQSRSHINLLLTSSSPELQGVVTGKVFEYFEAGSPIICLIKGVKDQEFENLFEELSAGIVTYDPPQERDQLKNYLLKCFNEVQRFGSIQHIINNETLIREYSWKMQAEKLLKL